MCNENGNGKSSPSTNGTLAKNRPYMDDFLARLRECGNIRLACAAAGIPRRTAYNWRDKWSTFAAEWDEAIDDACDLLEEQAWNRAKKNSDRLLMFLLKAHRPDKYKERTEHALTGKDGEPLPTPVIYLPDVKDG